VALAMKRAPITVTAGKNQTYFQGQVKKMSKTTGNRTGVYYTTAPPAGFTAVDPYYPNHNASVAGTAWCIFSECDFNPLGQ